MNRELRVSMQHITLRPIDPEDEEFLYRVYASTRPDIAALIDWTDEEKHAFLRQQFDLQHTYYQQEFPDAAYEIILSRDEPIGRLYLDRRDDEFRVLDITLLPEARGQGIGGYLMQQVLDEAAAAGKPVRIHVEQRNGAKRLYDRLGFQKIEPRGIYDFMEWRPGSNDEKTAGE